MTPVIMILLGIGLLAAAFIVIGALISKATKAARRTVDTVMRTAVTYAATRPTTVPTNPPPSPPPPPEPEVCGWNCPGCGAPNEGRTRCTYCGAAPHGVKAQASQEQGISDVMRRAQETLANQYQPPR